MNDSDQLPSNRPPPIIANPRGHFTHSLGLTGDLDENYVSPRVVLCRITNDFDRASETDILYAAEKRGYIDKLVIEVPDFQWAEDRVKAMLAAKHLATNDKWTCFLTFAMGVGDSAKLVFAFKSQVDRLLFSMEWPRGD